MMRKCFFVRHPEAILWGGAHRVADSRRRPMQVESQYELENIAS